MTWAVGLSRSVDNNNDSNNIRTLPAIFFSILRGGEWCSSALWLERPLLAYLFTYFSVLRVIGRQIQKKEHNSVEDARATMELFKQVKSEWKTDVVEETKKKKPASKSSQKRKRVDNSFSGTFVGSQFVKWPRIDSDPFFSDNYWPDDIQVCWF